MTTAIAACSSGSTAATAPTPTGSSTSVAATSTGSSASAAAGSSGPSASAATASAGGGGSGQPQIKIGIALTLTGIPSFTDMAVGAQAAGAKANASVQVVGPAQATGSGEATMAQNLETSLQPEGFGLNPCILNAWTRAISTIYQAVPKNNVIAVGCPPISTPSGTSPVKTFVGPSGFAQGYATAEAAIKGGNIASSATGTVLVAGCDPAVPNIVEGVNGIVAALKQDLPGITLQMFTSALDQTSNTAAWASQFAKYNKVLLAVGFCDQDAHSLLTLKERNVGGDFVAGVAEPTGAELTAIKNGVLAGGAQQASWLQGYLAVQLLAMQARGQAVPAGWVDSGNYIITKANVDGWIAAGASPSANEQLLAPQAAKILANLSDSTAPMANYFSRGKPPVTTIG